MVIAEINTLNVGSTGRIMMELADELRKEGDIVYTYSAKTFRRRTKNSFPAIKDHYYYGSLLDNFIHKVIGEITGFNGCFSIVTTLRLISRFKSQHIDILHLHNLHEFCINLPLLFRYIKHNRIPVVWTLHDCWSITGHCPYFTMVNCSRWKTGCGNCHQKAVYPKCILDSTHFMWKKKKKWFSNVENLTIVTPSNWLKSIIKESFLSSYRIEVINNGIDLDTFKPIPSTFRDKYMISKDKFLLLGVAFSWSEYKGLDVFADLAARLPDSYQIVLVGISDIIKAKLPNNILCIQKTNSQRELAEIYSSADLFVNPTREDNFPTVNIESLACGTPVLTFNTNGSPEIIDETCGKVVPYNDIDKLEEQIIAISNDMSFSREACRKRAMQYIKSDKNKEYIHLLRQVYEMTRAFQN